MYGSSQQTPNDSQRQTPIQPNLPNFVPQPQVNTNINAIKQYQQGINWNYNQMQLMQMPKQAANPKQKRNGKANQPKHPPMPVPQPYAAQPPPQQHQQMLPEKILENLMKGINNFPPQFLDPICDLLQTQSSVQVPNNSRKREKQMELMKEVVGNMIRKLEQPNYLTSFFNYLKLDFKNKGPIFQNPRIPLIFQPYGSPQYPPSGAIYYTAYDLKTEITFEIKEKKSDCFYIAYQVSITPPQNAQLNNPLNRQLCVNDKVLSTFKFGEKEDYWFIGVGNKIQPQIRLRFQSGNRDIFNILGFIVILVLRTKKQATTEIIHDLLAMQNPPCQMPMPRTVPQFYHGYQNPPCNHLVNVKQIFEEIMHKNCTICPACNKPIFFCDMVVDSRVKPNIPEQTVPMVNPATIPVMVPHGIPPHPPPVTSTYQEESPEMKDGRLKVADAICQTLRLSVMETPFEEIIFNNHETLEPDNFHSLEYNTTAEYLEKIQSLSDQS